jgi:hypothetical protein
MHILAEKDMVDGDDVLTFVGSAEELDALGHAFTQTARHPDSTFITYTGISGIKIKFDCNRRFEGEEDPCSCTSHPDYCEKHAA